MVGQNQKRWDAYLPQAEFAFNNMINRSIGASPFMAAYGHQPKQSIDIADIRFSQLSVENLISKKKEIYKAVEEALQ